MRPRVRTCACTRPLARVTHEPTRTRARLRVTQPTIDEKIAEIRTSAVSKCGELLRMAKGYAQKNAANIAAKASEAVSSTTAPAAADSPEKKAKAPKAD